MAKILAVLGATGQQGSSVVTYVLHDPDLSQEYKIRALTRDISSDKAKQLPKDVEIVRSDVSDRASLATAFTGVHTLFAMTTPAMGENALEIEYETIKTIADVAVEKGVTYIIFSTLSSITTISQGKYTTGTPFDAKAKGEQYIRGLPIKSAFYCPGSFMENFASQAFLAPKRHPTQDNTWIMTRNVSPETQMPLIDATGDSGKFVGTILAEPDKYQGKTIYAATKIYTLEEIAAILSKSTSKNIIYKQVTNEEFAQSLPPLIAPMFVDYFRYIEEYGYFGPNTQELIAQTAASHARGGSLSTFEEYLAAHPLQLA